MKLISDAVKESARENVDMEMHISTCRILKRKCM